MYYISFIQQCVHTYVYRDMQMEVKFRSWFSPYSMWVPGIKHRGQAWQKARLPCELSRMPWFTSLKGESIHRHLALFCKETFACTTAKHHRSCSQAQRMVFLVNDMASEGCYRHTQICGVVAKVRPPGRPRGAGLVEKPAGAQPCPVESRIEA